MSAYPNSDVMAETGRRRTLKPNQKRPSMNSYAHPEVLVETDWVKANLCKPGVKVVEIDVDTRAYDSGHIPGAVGFNWRTELQDQVGRDILGKEAFEKLVGGAGISPQDTVILYGDHNNWFAANGFWLFKVYGHKDVRLMNGGRVKWQSEPDKKLTTERPNPTPVPYQVTETHPELRALLPDVLQVVKSRRLQPGGRTQPRRVYGEGDRPAGDDRDRPARRARARGQEHSLGHPRRPGRDVQVGRRAADDLPGAEGRRSEPADDRLLPHRRALQPHLVRPELTSLA